MLCCIMKILRSGPWLALVLLGAMASGGRAQGVALTVAGSGRYQVADAAVTARWRVQNGRLRGVEFVDRMHVRTLKLEVPFSVLTADGRVYETSNLRVQGEPKRRTLTATAGASRYAERLAGQAFDVSLVSDDGDLRLVWSVVLRDGSAYVRQRLTLTAVGRDLPIARVELFDLALPAARVEGTVKGSPAVDGNLYFGFEDPLSEIDVVYGRMTGYVDRQLPLKQGASVTYSSVIGVARAGQLRRDFLAYLERERAHPYRTFLHYNSWYDLGYFTPYDEAGALDRVNAFGRELHETRGVTLDSYLFDDGWDNHASLWGFNQGFPNGFSAVRTEAEKYGAEAGVWMSPWGGYDGPKKERIAFGQKAGFEIVDGGFALSGPKYFARFREVCLQMIQRYGINQFKFDGTGNANEVFKGSAFDSDFSAALTLIADLRAAKPDLFINLTTGTTPSPFWLLYADSIWRGGEDDSYAGVGSYRERWITYRDADTYQEIVKQGPLYPLNSLMLHGIIYAQHHRELKADPGNDFRNEVRSYFGTGTQLQEMYITPSLLTQKNWDDLAEAAKWSRANAGVLKDTHWVGGDPAWLEVYGWASWTPKKAILVLRNPSDKPQSLSLDIGQALELPWGAARSFVGRRPWAEDVGKPTVSLKAGEAHRFELKPFEVLTLDLLPRQPRAQ
jgi:hypothetical protein